MVRTHSKHPARIALSVAVAAWLPAWGQAQPASAAAPARELIIKSLCPTEAARRCDLQYFDEAGQVLGTLKDVSNDLQGGLRAVDLGRDLLEVQLQGKTYRVARMGVILQRQRSPVVRAVDCTVVAGVRASGCDK